MEKSNARKTKIEKLYKKLLSGFAANCRYINSHIPSFWKTAGFSYTTWKKYCRGEYIPPLYAILAMAKTLHVYPSDIFTQFKHEIPSRYVVYGDESIEELERGFMSELGAGIAKRRTALHCSQEYIARFSELAPITVMSIENGRTFRWRSYISIIMEIYGDSLCSKEVNILRIVRKEFDNAAFCLLSKGGANYA